MIQDVLAYTKELKEIFNIELLFVYFSQSNTLMGFFDDL